MKKVSFSGITKKIMALAVCMAATLSFGSCDRLHEDLQPCPQGLRLRFVYDYNMEFANAFPSQVDCLTVLFYDQAGNYVTTRTNMTKEDLEDENWRMTVDLAPGQYTVLAYGGMECADASFSFVTPPASTSLQNIQVRLNPEEVGTELHPLFYGRLEAVVEENDVTYREVTVKMMKDTNNLRVMLQQVNGSAIDEADFDFKVIDDNTLMAWNNDVIPTQTVEYYPWTRGNASPGDLPGEGGAASVAYAEMSFPRLVTSNSPRLVITRKADGNTVIDIPLNNYLLLMKSEAYAWMPSQEFLDRESRWKMLFFLQEGGRWLDTVIEINDWVVRINNTSFES